MNFAPVPDPPPNGLQRWRMNPARHNPPMSLPREPSPSRPSRLHRLFGRWWRNQSPSRQDRFATMGPLVSVLLFLAAITAAFWYLRNEEIDRATESVRRDTEVAQQQIRLHLIENQEQLVRMARELVTRDTDSNAFLAQAAAFQRERPEVRKLAWLGANRKLRALQDLITFAPEVVTSAEVPDISLPVQGMASEPEFTFIAARDARQPVYSHAFTDAGGSPVFQVQVPLIDRGNFVGTLLVDYSIEALVRYFIPSEVTRRHAVKVLDANGKTLVSTVAAMPGQKAAPP